MRVRSSAAHVSVKVLAVFLAAVTSSCSFISDQFQESCQSHAYSQMILTDYMQTRFVPGSPVRLGVVPASVPANMSSFTNEQPGPGNRLAWNLHQELLNFGEIPIVQVLNRQDWPGKKEEFYTGNFGAIQYARDAGYDLVLVTNLEPPRNFDSLTALSKVIDTSSGVTVYYGSSTVTTDRPTLRKMAVPFGIMKREPSILNTNELFDHLAKCIARDIMAEQTTPR